MNVWLLTHLSILLSIKMYVCLFVNVTVLTSTFSANLLYGGFSCSTYKFNWLTMQLLSLRGQISITSAFNLVARQQWDFPSHAGTLYLHLRIASVSALVGCDQLKPSQASWV